MAVEEHPVYSRWRQAYEILVEAWTRLKDARTPTEIDGAMRDHDKAKEGYEAALAEVDRVDRERGRPG